MNALLIISGLGIISLVAEFANFKKLLPIIVYIGLIGAGLILLTEKSVIRGYYHDMVLFDHMALAFTALMIVITFLWFWMAGSFFSAVHTDRTAITLFVLVGGIMMVSFNNLSMLFLGIETLSISLYILAGSRKELTSTEAAFKYLLMGSFATGILLFGIALVYGATGELQIDTITKIVSENQSTLPSFFYVGVLMMMIGMLFKISAVPFHFWAPDVYTGSPTSVTAFMATVVKIAAMGAFIRLFGSSFGISDWQNVLIVVTLLTLIIPNVTAVFQSNVKRILAYSSVGQIGYILLLFISNHSGSTPAIFYYLFAYSVASLSTFNVVLMMENVPSGGSALANFNGLYKRNPLLAAIMSAGLLSLAGIPPFPGFFAKYMVFIQAIEAGYIGLVIVALIASLIGVYYYFRIIIAMYFKEAAENTVKIPLQAQFYLVASGIVLVLLTLFPDQAISMILP